jgi:hypothetical protein
LGAVEITIGRLDLDVLNKIFWPKIETFAINTGKMMYCSF